MNIFSIQTSDPLFSIIVVLILTLITLIITYFSSKYKSNKEQESIANLIKKYNYSKDENSVISLIENNLIPTSSAIFIAKSLESSGDYNESIKIYLTLLEKAKTKSEQLPLFQGLGGAYFKAGFLQRSKDIFLKALYIFQRDTISLNYLCIINEHLRDYKSAMEVLEPLEELNVQTKNLRGYLELSNLINTKKKNISDKIIELVKENIFLSRQALTYLIRNDLSKVWEHIEVFDFEDSIDLFWYLDKKDVDLDKIKTNKYLIEVFQARRFIDDFENSIFEFDVVSKLNRQNGEYADISFEYVCNECKNIAPIYNNRCHNCHALMALSPRPMITKKTNYNGITF